VAGSGGGGFAGQGGQILAHYERLYGMLDLHEQRGSRSGNSRNILNWEWSLVAVRDGELTPEQRERLGDLLHSVGTAVGLARRDRYPDNDSAALGYLIATWAPVSSA
jgi:hypothetical protein